MFWFLSAFVDARRVQIRPSHFFVSVFNHHLTSLTPTPCLTHTNFSLSTPPAQLANMFRKFTTKTAVREEPMPVRPHLQAYASSLDTTSEEEEDECVYLNEFSDGEPFPELSDAYVSEDMDATYRDRGAAKPDQQGYSILLMLVLALYYMIKKEDYTFAAVMVPALVLLTRPVSIPVVSYISSLLAHLPACRSPRSARETYTGLYFALLGIFAPSPVSSIVYTFFVLQTNNWVLYPPMQDSFLLEALFLLWGFAAQNWWAAGGHLARVLSFLLLLLLLDEVEVDCERVAAAISGGTHGDGNSRKRKARASRDLDALYRGEDAPSSLNRENDPYPFYIPSSSSSSSSNFSDSYADFAASPRPLSHYLWAYFHTYIFPHRPLHRHPHRTWSEALINTSARFLRLAWTYSNTYLYVAYVYTPAAYMLLNAVLTILGPWRQQSWHDAQQRLRVVEDTPEGRKWHAFVGSRFWSWVALSLIEAFGLESWVWIRLGVERLPWYVAGWVPVRYAVQVWIVGVGWPVVKHGFEWLKQVGIAEIGRLLEA
ncbi:hypothetical protein BDV95DRAFT_591450 [Massariosphaeria phaeospora]|uniref:Uncharacterized protein n=1 Tax=Massariosphaeria phaeospora TaxID=100035 RepID=A0A7C8ML35_9PLEO|nr:hypothetical protein BDV95DRAFT_591450 [Massariosphaeria phaeospora]